MKTPGMNWGALTPNLSLSFDHTTSLDFGAGSWGVGGGAGVLLVIWASEVSGQGPRSAGPTHVHRPVATILHTPTLSLTRRGQGSGDGSGQSTVPTRDPHGATVWR